VTTKIISTYIAGGYTIPSRFSELDITSTGGVGGFGVESTHNLSIVNDGLVNGSRGTGVRLLVGGRVSNYGHISGANGGVYIDAGPAYVLNGSSSVTDAYIGGGYNGIYAASVVNFGTIAGGTGDGSGSNYAVESRIVINGSVEDFTALMSASKGVRITGSLTGAGVVLNFGTITGANVDNGLGIYMPHGGTITNGSTGDESANIYGTVFGVDFGEQSTVSNYGTITAVSYAGVYGKIGTVDPLTLTNGAPGDTSARIQGSGGVQSSAFASISNFGTIDGVSASGGMGAGVSLSYGGVVHNGGGGDFLALIEGPTGIYSKYAYASVSNFGIILGDFGAPGHTGSLGDGVQMLEGGAVVNGFTGDTAALIKGSAGITVRSLPGTVSNFGTILGDYFYGVQIFGGGDVTNGSASDSTARISGYGGIYFNSAGAVANFGTVTAIYDGNHGIFGVDLAAASGGTLTNGAAGDTAALISGYVGVRASGAAQTVTNFGTIVGSSGVALEFASPTDVLVRETGSVFTGQVFGDGAMLDLDTGAGVLGGLISTKGDVMVSEGKTQTTFSDFFTLEIGAKASFVTSGVAGLAAGQTVNDFGALTIGGGKGAGRVVNAGLIETSGSGILTINAVLANTGVLSVSGGLLRVIGATSGTGHALINGGTLDFLAKSNQGVTFTGKGSTLELGQAQSFTGKITGFAVATTLLDLDNIQFVSPSEATFSGGRKSGVLTISDGKTTAHVTLEGNYQTATFIAASDGHGGVIVQQSAPPLGPLAFIAAMAGLGNHLAGGLVHADQTSWVRQPTLANPRIMAV